MRPTAKEQAEKEIREKIEGAASNIEELKALVEKHADPESLNYVARLLSERNAVTERNKEVLRAALQRATLQKELDEHEKEVNAQLNVLDKRILDLQAYLNRPVAPAEGSTGTKRKTFLDTWILGPSQTLTGSVRDISVATGTAAAGIGSWAWNGILSGLGGTRKFLTDLSLPENMSRRGSQAWILVLGMLGMENNAFVGPWISAQISGARKNIASCDIARTVREEKADALCFFNGEIGEAEWEEYYTQIKGPPLKTEPSIKVLTHKFIKSVRKQNPGNPVPFTFSDILKKPEQLAQDDLARKNEAYIKQAKDALPAANSVVVADSPNGKVTIDLDKRAVTIPSDNIGVDFATINGLLLAQSSVCKKIELENNGRLTDTNKIRVFLDQNSNPVAHIRKDASRSVIDAMINGGPRDMEFADNADKSFELKNGNFVEVMKVSVKPGA